MGCSRCAALERMCRMLYAQLVDVSAQLHPPDPRPLPDPPCPGGCGLTVRTCRCVEVEVQVEMPPLSDAEGWAKLLAPAQVGALARLRKLIRPG